MSVPSFHPAGCPWAHLADLGVTNILSFCLSGNVLISLLLLKDSFARYRIPGWQFSSFCTLKISDHCFWSPQFLMRNLMILRVLCMWCVASHLLPSRFSLSLAFDNLIIICLSVSFFKFILLGIHWASWMFIFMSLIKFGSFHPLFLQIFSAPFSHSSLSGKSYNEYVSSLDGFPQVPQALFMFRHSFFFSSVPQTQ